MAAKRRKAITVLAVLIVAAGAVHDVRTTPPLYADGATVVFSAANRLAQSVGVPNFDHSLIVTEVMLAQTMTGHVRTPAGTTELQALPCNISDLEYPDYSEQCATLTTTAPGAAAARQALSLAYHLLSFRLAKLQAASGVVPRNRIRTYLVGVSGPLPQQGSKARVLAGLALLTLIGVLTVSRFVTRHGGGTWRFRRRRSGHRRSRWPAATPRWRRGEVS
ncbi:MAG: hypothetical protein ACR2MP_17180 [Streptosporangiaceae bacterium]